MVLSGAPASRSAVSSSHGAASIFRPGGTADLITDSPQRRPLPHVAISPIFELGDKKLVMRYEPVVSVVLPICNGESHLESALESLLGQTLEEIEIIAVDDASTDGTPDVLRDYSKRDERLRVVSLAHETGASATCNRGLQAARGMFVAWARPGDISESTRLEVEVRYLKERPRIGLCGSHMVSLENPSDRYTCPENPDFVQARLLFLPSVFLQSAMCRREVMEQYGLLLAPRCTSSAEYEMLLRCTEVAQVGNVAQALVQFRDDPIPRTASQEMLHVRRTAFEKSFGALDGCEAELLTSLVQLSPMTPSEIGEFQSWVEKLERINNVRKTYNRTFFRMASSEAVDLLWSHCARAMAA